MNELLLRIADRLNAPNEASTFRAIEGALRAAAKRLWGAEHTLAHDAGDGRGLFTVRLRAATTEARASDLLARL